MNKKIKDLQTYFLNKFTTNIFSNTLNSKKLKKSKYIDHSDNDELGTYYCWISEEWDKKYNIEHRFTMKNP